MMSSSTARSTSTSRKALHYPKNDCEDRAIFYAYLVHEILGLDVHLIQFPGHECTAVAFHEPVENGTSYEYKGKKFYICDLTVHRSQDR